MDFDIEGARKAGYGDDEIADFLGKQRGFDTRAARDAGYSTAEIMAHLSDSWARKALPAGVAPSNAGGGRGGLGGPTAEMLAQPKRRTLGDATAGPGAALANIRENETLRQQRLNPPDPLSVPDPAAAPSLIEQRGAPISAQAQQELTDRLAAMPQAERQALQQDARLPAWMRDAASKINPVLDASTEGAARVGMSGPTLESRRDFLIKNGARADVAMNQARGEAQRRQTTQAGAQATALPESLLTPDEEAAARAQGREVSKRGSIAARGMFAAREGMAGGTAGVMAAALRAIGDDETAAIYEKVGRAADVRATAANELQLMQERARDSGMLPSGPLSGAADYMERMAVDAANSVGQMTPGLVAGLAGQGGLGMALMVTPVFGQSYVAGREAGKSPGAAAAYAAPMAALEYVGERYGLLPAAMKALRDKAATKSIEELPAWAERAVAAMEKRGLFQSPVAAAALRGAVGEQIGEQITGIGQYLIDGTEFGLDKPISLSGFLENARDTAVQTLLATGAIQAAGYGVKGAIGGSKPAEKAPGATADAPPAVDLVALRQQHNQLAGLLDAGKIDAGKEYSPEQIAAAAGGMAAKPQARQGAEVLDDDGTGLASDAAPASRQRIRGDEPPLADGMVRMYHGSAQRGRYEGKAWFSSNRDYAANYRRGAELQYVDMPADRINAIADPDGYGQTVERGFTVNHEFDSSETGPRRPLVQEPSVETDLDQRAHAAATSPTNDRPEPTQAQKEAGNYAKGHVRVAGLDIAIENPQGSVRRGVDPDGKPWENTLQAHYGYIKGTLGNDKDHVDLFIKPGTPEDYAGPVFVIDQVHPDTGKFDEHKVVLGAATEDEARQLYQANYAKDWNGAAAVTRLPMPAFKSWVKDGAKREPLGDINARAKIDTAPAEAPQSQPAPAAPGPAAAPSAGAAGAAGVPAAGALDAAQAAGLSTAPKQAKARKPGPRIEAETDTMLQALAKAGGVSREELAREFGLKPEELKATVKAGNLKGYPFRKGGMGIDRAIETLQQHGYFDGVADEDVRGQFEDAIFSELGGSPRLSTAGQMRQAEQAGAAMAQEAEALQVESEEEAQAEREAIIVAESVLSEAEIQALQDDDIPDLYAELNSSPEALMRALGFTEQEIADELAREQAAAAQAGDQQDRQAGPRAEGESPSRTGRQEGRDVAPGEAEGLTLSAQTEQDLRARAEREREAAAADAKKQADLKRRADADAQREEFTLTGSDRPADVAAAAGQSGLFDAPAREAVKPAANDSKPKKLSKAQQVAQEQRERLANYLKPGNVVRSYGGFDEVLEFRPAQDGKPWAVKVHEVREEDGKWVRQGKPQDARWHSTMPEDRLMRNGPRAVLKPMPGEEVPYSEPRADGRPFANAPGRGVAPAEDAAPAVEADSEAKAKALEDLNDALGDLADIFGKNAKFNITPEQEQKLLPVLTRVMDAAFRAGYYSFKDAARFVLDKIRSALGAEVADQITVEHLQGAYIGMSGRYRAQGADAPAAVVAVTSKQEIEGAQRSADTSAQEPANVPSTDPDLERNSRGTAAAAPAVEAPVRPQDRGAAERAERAGERDRREGEGRARDAGLPADGTPADGEQSDQPVRGDTAGAQPAGRTAGVDDDPRGGGLGDRGVQPDAVAAAEAAQPVDRGAERGRKLAAQRAAERIAPRAADLDSIRETLPVLLPGQQDDVFKAEQRHAAPDGYGILFTNQPGTGKTYTGLGIIKRVQRMGSEDVLIVAPSDKVIEDWIKSGQDLGLSISQLADTKSAGRGIVITTYANLGQNLALASRHWRLVVTDESHYLMQEKDGRPTSALATLRAITLHPDGAYQRARMLHADLHSKASELAEAAKAARASDDLREQARAEKLDAQARDAWAAYEQARKDVQADVAARQGSARTRVAFLSATPFAYEKTVDYAQGYLFDYGEGKSGQNLASGSGAGHGYNSGDWRDQFFMQHFGYRMRYNKLTEPDAKVDRGLMQRQFNGWLKKRGALSGRMLEVEPDYDRRFILVDSAIGTRIDEALDWISEMDRAQPNGGPNGYRKLGERINKKFDYLSRRYLLEAIKASEVLPHVREHLALGRKVVVFHDYKKGGGFNPFDISRLGEDAESEEGAQGAAAHNVALDEFRSQFRDLIEFPFSTMPSPIALFKRELPDVLLFNGDISPKDRRAAVAKFQDDATGPAVILVQSAAGKEGISLHDTTGKHQRVLFNLGQPTQPTTAIQQEGRIYRTGQVTDAVIRYLNTGTNWEKWAFATTIAERASAAENLGMGELARALKDGFIAAFEESGDFRAGHEGEGQGGKARDRAANEVISEFDRARGFYWGTQKKDSRTKAKEGADYYATPEPLGLKLVQWLDLRGGEDAAEPSAGHGAIARWFPENVNRTAVEPSGTLRARLAMVFEGRILPSNFEDLHLVNKFDGIAMNPPFGSGGRTAIDHLDKATQHLREGGRVAAIIPTGPAADKKLEAWFYEQKDGKSVRPDLHLVADIKLPGVTFERAGTTVMSRIVVIDRLAKGQASPGQVSRDLTGIEDINELFDRIRDMELPARTKPQPTPEDLERQAAAKPASEYAAARDLRKQADEERAQQGAKQAQDLGMPIIEHLTTKGKTLRGVVRKDLSQAQAKQADEFTFKKDGGWFIREKNIGKLLELFPLKMSLAGRRGTRAVPYPPSTKPEDLKVAAEIKQFVDMATGKPGAHPVVALDGTDASPELRGARALARAIFGHRVVFVHQPKGRLFNAIVDTAAGNTIAIDVTTDKPVMAVLGHELLHRMRALRPELYHQLRAKLAEVMSDPKAYADRLNERRAAKGLPPLDDDILTEERIADVVGDQFTDQRFWSELAQADRSLFQRIGDAVLQFIDDVVAKITKRRPFGTDQFIRDLKAARAAVVEAMAEFSRAQGDGAMPAAQDVRLSLADHTPEEQEALARAGLAGKPSVGQKLRAAYGRAMDLVRDRQALADEARQGVLDQFHGIRRALQGEVGALPIDQDPYIAARLANGGTSSVMRGLLLHGQARWADNMQHLEKIPGTKGLLDILAPLGDDVNDFFGWMVGNRAARLMKEGRENNFTPDQVKALQGLAKGRRAEFVKIAAEYSQFKRSVLDFAEEAGIIDPVARKAWDHADYIPFYRQIDEKASFSPTGRRGLAGQSSGIRTLRGGTAALNDPLENLLMNFSRLVDASLKNNAINKTIATLEDAGSDLVEKVGYDMGGVVVPTSQVKRLLMEAGTPEEVLEAIPPEAFEGMAKMWAIQAPSDPDVVRIMRGGKPVFYRVREPLLLRALTSFVPFDFPGLGAMRAFKRLLTAMVTAEPAFMVRNFIRDSVAAQAIARDGFNPAKSIKGVVESYAEGGGFESMLFAGASFQSGHVNAADPTGTSAALRRALRAKGMDAAAIDRHLASLIDTPAKFWEKYRQVGEAIENANRDAVYTAAQQAGKSATAAAYEAKDLMDFNLRGAWPAYQLLADVLPFFNARVQGLYRLGRADPKRLAQVGLLLTAASLMLAFANDGEDWYEELPDWDKDTNWHFRIGGHHFKIPKPFEIGVIFATVPERLARYIKQLDSGGKTADRLWANVRDQLAFDPVPQMLRPAVDVFWKNRDTFRDSPIESQSDEGKLPHSRYSARTSDTMRLMAGAAAPASDFTGLSPKRLEYLVRGYFGTVGAYALGASDMLVRELEGKPAGPALRLDDLPLIKSFYSVDPARSTVFENDLYKMREEVQKISKTVKAYAKEGDLVKQRELMAKDQKKLAAEPVVTSAAKSLGALNKARDAIIADPKMSPEEKRRRIDELQLRKNALAKKVMTTPAVIAAQ